ncbi:MAG: hypothetical protein ACI97A_001492 [Planctomycetota bacterium]
MSTTKQVSHGFLFCILFTVGCLTNASAQSLEERVKALEQQNKKLAEQNHRIETQSTQILQRLLESEKRNTQLATRLSKAEEHSDGRSDLILEAIGAMANDTGGGAGGYSAGPISRSGFGLQFYGTIRFEASYSDSRFNRAIDPQWVRNEDGIFADDDDDQFSMNARRSTLGLNADLGRVGDALVRGKLEFDFAGFDDNEPENRAHVRLLLAYVDFQIGAISLRFGQDWDILAPLDPVVDNQRHLWDTGNLGDRRPLAQAFYTGGSRSGIGYSIGVALGMSGAVDNSDADTGFGSFLTTERDGIDSGQPHVQIAANVEVDSWVRGERIRLGVSGAWGRLETDTKFNGEDHFTTWALSFDLILPVFAGAHIKAEGFMGQALADFRGGISQSLNLTEGREIDSVGGFAEFFWQVDDFFGWGFGGSIDNPDFDDLDLAMRASNWTLYFATRFNWGKGVSSGLDVIFWKTQYADREDGDALRINAFVELTF